MKNFVLIVAIILMHSISAHAQHEGHGAPAQTKQKPSSPPSKARPNDEARVTIQVSPNEQRKIGLRTVRAKREPVSVVIRTVGTVAADQTREAHVHTRLNGWIERIFVDTIGKPVQKGDPLFELYSPELVSTQEEYLAARRSGAAGREISQAALERLRGWNVPESEIEKIKAAGKSKRTVAFDSPVTGFVVNKTAIQGMYITPEMELYHIADLSRIWILVTLYESDLNSIQVGDLAKVQLPYDETRTFRAPISYLYPEIDLETRTSRARIELENKARVLKPGMFVDIEISKSLGDAVTVPEDAVIDTGARKLVFVKKDQNQFEPREIKIGPRVDGKTVVASGLSAGAEIVVSSHFLLDAESKVQAALKSGEPVSREHESHGKNQ